MKKLVLFMLVLMLPLYLINCGGGPKPVEEVVTIEPEPEPEPEVKPEPIPEPEPEIVPVKASDFAIIYFDFDKYNLVDSAKKALEGNARVLKDNPTVVIKIEGHCDERGTVEYNLSLGEKRANSAMDYLKSLGIAPNRMSMISYGKSRPAVQGSNESTWAKNRRCEFKIVSQ
nr:peptidoglycan-associated lipoprotein Pal [candidate division Zixibacteria bacterium]